MVITLKLNKLGILVESSYSFKFITLFWTADSKEFEIEYRVKEDDNGLDLTTVEVRKSQKSHGKQEILSVEHISDKMINLFIKDLESLADIIETDNLIISNDIFEACDCPTKVPKYQKFRDEFVEKLKDSKLSVITEDIDYQSNHENLLIFDFPSLESREIEGWRWQLDYYPDDLPYQMCYHLADMEPSDIWKLIEVFFLSKDPPIDEEPREFFFYHLITKPKIYEILENFEIPVINELSLKKSPIKHTQFIAHPTSPYHYFLVIVSDNAVSGTLINLRNLKKQWKRVVKWHSWRRKIRSFWPFFAIKTCYDKE